MKVTAHRGYSGRYPENTMLAFKKRWKPDAMRLSWMSSLQRMMWWWCFTMNGSTGPRMAPAMFVIIRMKN